MKLNFNRSKNISWRQRLLTPGALLRLFVLTVLLVGNFAPLAGITHSALAAGGDFSINFSAAAPFTYTHATGGGAVNDGTIGKANDVVESLEGGDFSCGDTVTYFTAINVGGDGSDDPQTIEITLNFLADTTGQSGAAHFDVTNVAVNYGQVENGDDGTGINPGAGSFGLDSGIVDDGGSTATIISEAFDPAGTSPFNGADELILVFQVDDLEMGEDVVVRIDTALTCDPGSNPTGNLQADLGGAQVVAPVIDTISAGAQTIPFKQIGDLAGAGEPLLNIQKSVTTVGGTCGIDDVEELAVTAGDTVQYCYVIDNPGTADLFDVEIIDDNGTPSDISDDFAVTLSGLADLDSEADLGDLASGATTTGSALVTIAMPGTVVNTAVVSGSNGASGGNARTLTAEDTATVITETPPNLPPVAVDDSATTPEDTAVTIPASTNDTDPDGNLVPSSAVVTSGPNNGTVVNNGDGTFTYTPDSNFNGTDSFTYEICDAFGLCDTAVVTITVDPVNDPPVALDDAETTPEDTPVTVDAAANDSDVDGNLDPSSATVISEPTNGTVVNNGDGTFTYTPDADFNGTDSFEYQICDTDGLCDTATITIDVTPVNDGPIANDDAHSTAEDTTLVIPAPGILENDSDVDGDALTVNLLTNPSNGTLTQNADGSFTYVPDVNFNGVDSYTYEACDPSGLCDTATVTITVDPINDNPIAVDDAYSTDEDTTLIVSSPGILGNDSDIDGDVLTVNLLTSPSNGTLTQNADGSFTYVPDADFNGVDSYTYEACDPSGLCDSATVTITVNPVNDGPVAEDDAYTTAEDTTLNIAAPGILSNDSDIDGDALTVNLLTSPSNGTLTQNADGSFSYTPDANFNGVDSYTYEACDPSGLCDEATVTITVEGVNDGPVAVDDAYSADEDTALTVPAPGILGNDSDVDGDALTVNLLTSPSNGALTQNADGSFTYVPNANFNGEDSYTYEACDPSGLCDTAVVIITVNPVNDPPVANDDTAVTDEDMPVDIPVLDNDSDPENDPLTVTEVSDPPNGTVTINPDGTVTYTPDPNFNGEDTFTYTVCDDSGLCDTATVTVVIGALNDPPVANDDAATTPEDTPVLIDAAANDSDVDGNLDPSSATVLNGPANGTVVNNGDGTFTYTPDPDFNGSDSFTYEICDTDGLCDMATVTVDVTPVNDPPVAVDDSASTPEDSPVTIPVTNNDSDVDGNLDPTSVSIIDGPANGEVVVNPDGTVTYNPDPDFNGSDSFTYEICDTDGACDTAVVTIDVTPVNDPPVAADDSASTDEDSPVTIPVANNDSDVDGNLDPTSVSIVDGPANGEVVVNPDGTVTYTPDPDFNGEDNFTYEICDTDGLCDTAVVTVTVNPVNDAPVAEDDAYSTPEDTELLIAAPGILGNDSDVDGDALTVNLLTSPSNGTLTQNADGSFSYLPNANFNGVDSYTYEACDPSGLCDPATVTITVDPVNDDPTAVDDAYSTDEDTPLTVADPGVLGNDSDIDGDTLFVESYTQPANGMVTQNPDGSLTYTPNPDFNGVDSYTYTISDGNGGFDTATVTITVNPINDAPVAVDDAYSVDEDASISIPAPEGILDNDYDVDGDTLTVTLLTGPSHGTLAQNADGSFTYTPDADFNGEDSYTYEACDPSGLCDPATVYLTVNPVNDPPVAVDDSYVTLQNVTLTVDAPGVLLNDSDPIDGDAVFVDSYDATSDFDGTVSLNADGSFSYTPATDFAGIDTFTYTISDGNGGYDTATVTVEVTAKNGRSISVDWGDWTRSGQQLDGYFNITNQSGPYDVQLRSFEIQVQYRTKGQWVDVAVSGCTFDPMAPTLLHQDPLTVNFSGCELADAIPDGATVRVTAVVQIYGHKDKGHQKEFFLSRLSK